MPSQTKGPSDVEIVSKSGSTLVWDNPSNALLSDNAYTTVAIPSECSEAYTDYLVVTNFGFSVPSDYTIVGILARIENKADSYSLGDNRASLYNSGLIGGSKYCGPQIPENFTNLGGSTDCWGASLTPAIVNGASFGLSLYIVAGDVANNFYLDYIELTVYYSHPPSTPTSAPTMSPSSPTSNPRPTFTGSYSDPDGDSGYLSFEIRTGASGAGTLVASGNSSTVSSDSNASWQPSSDLSPGAYYCRYKRVDSYNLSSGWSPDLTFTILTAFVPKIIIF